MYHLILGIIVAFLMGNFFLYLSVKEYRSGCEMEDRWRGKAISLELDGIIQDNFMSSFLTFLLAIGFYGFCIYMSAIAVFGSAT